MTEENKSYRRALHLWFKDGKWHCNAPETTLVPNLSWKQHGIHGKGLTVRAAYQDYLDWKAAEEVCSGLGLC